MTETYFQTLHEIVAAARRMLSREDWDYLVGGSETETTLRRNRHALDSIAFRPRVLRDVSKIDTSVEHLGRRLRLPLLLAPIGSLETFGQGGGAVAAKAAQQFGVVVMHSSVCQPSLEEVAAAAPDSLRIAMLYVRGDDSFVEDYVSRATAAGYAAFCVTVDVARYSRRERDIGNRYAPRARRNVASDNFQAALDWRTIKLIKQKLDIPLVLKGIATIEDAKIALDHGVEWIYVSNHGGRQLDHGRGTMEVLSEIVDAVAGRAKIMVDGGFCRGTDIVKGIAAGADLVGIGRLYCFGLAAAGQAGIVRILELLEDEVQRCLGLLGITGFAALDRSYLHPAMPVTRPHALGAFPLLEDGHYVKD